MAACAGLVRDWKEADRIATTAKVNRLVRYARLGVPGVVARDGAIGLAESGVTWFVRGHFIPEGIRSLSGSKAGL